MHTFGRLSKEEFEKEMRVVEDEVGGLRARLFVCWGLRGEQRRLLAPELSLCNQSQKSQVLHLMLCISTEPASPCPNALTQPAHHPSPTPLMQVNLQTSIILYGVADAHARRNYLQAYGCSKWVCWGQVVASRLAVQAR